jgi:hypothetical protein
MCSTTCHVHCTVRLCNCDTSQRRLANILIHVHQLLIAVTASAACASTASLPSLVCSSPCIQCNNTVQGCYYLTQASSPCCDAVQRRCSLTLKLRHRVTMQTTARRRRTRSWTCHRTHRQSGSQRSVHVRALLNTIECVWIGCALINPRKLVVLLTRNVGVRKLVAVRVVQMRRVLVKWPSACCDYETRLATNDACTHNSEQPHYHLSVALTLSRPTLLHSCRNTSTCSTLRTRKTGGLFTCNQRCDVTPAHTRHSRV